ncbi:MAG: DUF4249 domain-containing protein [Bacteroidota bacterium]|jgi:hypothetical protein|nr:MAG: hypothetical protein DIU61_13605 [Bacteroidota bacterium]
MIRTLSILLCFVLYVALSCVDPFNPPQAESTTQYLVVDGIVDLADPESRIRLSRSMPLNQREAPVPVSGAEVRIELEDGTLFFLPEVAFGEYSATGVTLNDGQTCKLNILINSVEQYVSDPVTFRESPPIDSITWSSDGREVSFEVTTHDGEGDSRYYRWKTVETTMYNSTHNSVLIWDPVLEQVRNRLPEEWIYYCWKTTPFSDIDIFSTKGLAEDKVIKHRIFSIPANSWKLGVKYSLQVKQFVIDQDEFNFWTELRKNTESIGTIFDPQPTQVTGNINSIDPDMPKALGYFSIGRSAEDRIFVSVTELPHPDGGYERALPICDPFDVDTIFVSDYLASDKSMLIINGVTLGAPFIIAYLSAPTYCIDCRIIHGGTNRRPEFWE